MILYIPGLQDLESKRSVLVIVVPDEMFLPNESNTLYENSPFISVGITISNEFENGFGKERSVFNSLSVSENNRV